MADIKNSYIRPKKEDTIVYGRIVSASTEGVVADAGQIYDEQLKIGQHELNERVVKSGIGTFAGIPIYTKEIIDSVDPDDILDKYILIADKQNDLKAKPSRVVKEDGSYVDILFSAIRALQSEVARIKNSFKYGINSYTGENTSISSISDGINDPDDEPLWAVDEGDLSLITQLTIGNGCELIPVSNLSFEKEGVVKITGDATWDDDGKIRDVEDPKVFMYFTVTNPDVNIYLTDGENQMVFNINSIELPKSTAYNIMVCISRTVKNLGNNYIYISIGDAIRDNIYAEGYYYDNKLNKIRNDIGYQYYPNRVVFTDTDLSLFDICSKYQDFSNQVIPSAPSEQNYKYEVSHITIRSVKSEDVLKKIKSQIQNNELTFVESTNNLWIKNNNKLVKIAAGGGVSPEDGMTESEILDLLKKNGIICEDGKDLRISNLSDITFIHQDTGKRYKFFINESGELINQPVPNNDDLLSSRIQNSGVELDTWSARGFIGRLRLAEYNKANPSNKLSETQNIGLCSDRLKIGAFYAPLDTDVVHGCTRAFVELENTSDSDFCLQGCYLHYTRPTDDKQTVYHLPLTGTIKAGGTYVIAGAYYGDKSDENAYIQVDSYDQEWYENGKLIDFTINTKSDLGNGFALTYGNEELTETTYLWKANDSSITTFNDSKTYPNLYDPSFIDAIYFYKGVIDSSKTGYWAKLVLSITSNTMYKNTFELDPAQQAYQSANVKDSSRARWANTSDVWIVDLSQPTITFPHSTLQYNISNFQPKASYLNKNVCTDKSKINKDKPNMVTCSFGVNLHKDRAFNWISTGYHDEYIWIRQKGQKDWQNSFESYKTVEQPNEQSSTYPRRKEFSKDVNNVVYSRIVNRFPADGTQYTSHKCVINVVDQPVTGGPQVWEYVVGRPDIKGNPGSYISDVQTFTLYPETYKPVIYQTTDQQGFDWLQYQVWAAAANKLNEKITEDQNNSNIIPILVNTGDMTQNGTRINEWFDYYNAGSVLFSKLEQMNIVGNNDLCGTTVTDLGTGDDLGKSNSFYFHVFYCYDIDESTFVPIVNSKYIPSLYYFESKNYRFVMINSEITMINCSQWFNLKDGEDTVNIYTGYSVGANKKFVGGFTPIYTMVYNMLNTNKKCIAACHEMPFTVITNSSISTGQEKYSRSLGPNGSALIGSHCNQIDKSENGHGTYWLSRLLEYKGVKLMIGGHKHTYACTYPVREYFFFGQNKNSKDNFAEYSMSDTLQYDNVRFVEDGKDYTKFPLTKREDVGQAPTGFFPYTSAPNLEGGVTYFMCQATGFKLTSNKELPSANQKFSLAIPETTVKNGKDTANANQKYPMFGIIRLVDSNYSIELVRIANILTNTAKFTQYDYSTSPMKLQYFKQVANNNYGEWVDAETTMLTI